MLEQFKDYTSRGWTYVTGPGTYSGEFFGIFSIIGGLAPRLVAPNSCNHGQPAGEMTDVGLPERSFLPIYFTEIELPEYGAAYLLNAKQVN